MTDKDKKLKKYGQSKNGNFKVIDTIGVPHPYCLTPKHIAYAADHFGGMLGKEAIKEAEKNGRAVCDICKKINQKEYKPILTIDEHEQALVVSCSIDPKKGENGKELKKYLLSIKEMAEADNFAGFSFLKKF